MKISFSTLGCPEWTLNEICATAKDLGYDGVEFRGLGKEIFAPKAVPFLPENVAATRARFDSLGLAVPCLDSDSMLHQLHFIDHAKASVYKYIDLAQALGAPYIRVLGDLPNPWPGLPVDETLVRDSLQELGEEAGRKGVTLLLESNGWYSDTERLAKMLDSVALPSVAALWDVHHPCRYNHERPEDTIANLGGYIRHCHIKDSVVHEDGKVRYMMLGQGTLPVEDIIGRLCAYGYSGFYSLEWLRRWDLTLEVPGIAFAQFVSYMRTFEN